MKLVGEPFFVDGKLTAGIVACTNDEYEKYMQNGDFHDDINANPVSAKYFKEYLSEKGEAIKNIEKHYSSASSAVGEEAFIQWGYAPTLTVQLVKEFLAQCNLSYSDFIDTYAQHLKSL